MIPSPVHIPLPCETIDALEEELAPWLSAESLALPAVEHLALGSVVDVVLRLTDGTAALTLRAFVEWRHPAASPPPGHDPRTGLAVLAVDDASQGLWRRLVARSEAQAPAEVVVERGAALGRVPRTPQLEPRWRLAPVDERSAAERRDRSEAWAARARQHRLGSSHESAPAARSVPPPEAAPADSPPRPELAGAAFVFEYPGRGLEVSVGRLERFAWPLVGTLRPSRSDVRTAHNARHPIERPPDDDSLDSSVVEEPPTAAAPAGVPAAAPRHTSEPDDDVFAAAAPKEEMAAPLTSLASQGRLLNAELLLRVNDDDATLLLPREHPLPATIEARIPVDEGRTEVTASLFEGDGERLSRHLWTGSLVVPLGTSDVSVHLELDDEGVLRLRSPDDDELQVQLHVASARHKEPAQARGMRPWWRRLLGR